LGTAELDKLNFSNKKTFVPQITVNKAIRVGWGDILKNKVCVATT